MKGDGVSEESELELEQSRYRCSLNSKLWPTLKWATSIISNASRM